MKPSVYLLILLSSIFLCACTSPGLRILTIDKKEVKCVTVDGPLKYARPFSPSNESDVFCAVDRVSATELAVHWSDYSGRAIRSQRIPVYEAGYWGSYFSISPDGSFLAYSRVKDVSTSPKEPEYQDLVYIVDLKQGRHVYPDGDKVHESNAGLFFFNAANDLFVIGYGRDGSTIEYSHPNFTRKDLFKTGNRLQAYPSPKKTKVVVQCYSFTEKPYLRIFSLESGALLGSIEYDPAGLATDAVVWDNEDRFYYASDGAVREVTLPSVQSRFIAGYDKSLAAQLRAIDCFGRIHLSFQKRSTMNWAGEGWFILDPKTAAISRAAGIYYVREVIISPDRRHIVIASGM